MPIAATASSPAAAVPLDNRGFLVALAQALLALALSALLLIGGYVVFSPELRQFAAEASRDDLRRWTFDGADLQARMGSGEPSGDKALAITALEQGIDQRAIFSRRTRLKAEDYPFLESAIEGLHPGLNVYFIWRTQREPNEVFFQPVYWTGDKAKLQLLAKHPQWRGSITEIGLDVYGELREPDTVVRRLSLRPSSAGNLLKSVWAEWTAFRGWTQKSAHHLRGTPPDPILHVTPAMAAWAGGALLLLAGGYLLTRRNAVVPCVIAVAVPWIGIDLLWQHNLSTQLDETKYLFADKTMHERHQADWESDLYAYAQHLKNEVLPEPGVRIFLLHEGPLRGYRRLRMQHYLLPHNIFNFGHYPRPDHLQPGDYLLVLDQIEDLSFQAASLRWPGNSLPVEMVDQHPIGSLYRYAGEQ